MTNAKTILLTGGTGFIGRKIHEQSARSRWAVRNLGRKEPPPYQWTLGQRPAADAFENIDAVIHGAYDSALTDWDDIKATNIDGTARLFEAAAAGGVERFVYLSSIAAFEGCESDYGRAKLACEAIARDHDAIILRPGLVYGEGGGGVYGAMENWVRTLPVTPVLVPSPAFYMCHVRDLCGLIGEIVAEDNWRPGVVTTACATPLDFKNVVRTIQRGHQVRKPLLPVPWRLPWLACKVFEVFGLKPPFRSDGLVGLMKSNPAPDFSALANYRTGFRNFTMQLNQQD